MTLGTLSPEMEERDSKLGRILNPQGISEPLPGAAVTLVRSRGDTCLTSLLPGLVPPACCLHPAGNCGSLEFGLGVLERTLLLSFIC